LLKRYFVFTCLLIVSALALAACGSGKSDESQIEEAAETSATSTDPADCKKLSTQQFMEQVAQTEGPEAVKRCEREASEKKGAKSATVSNVEVDGSKATADVALTGGGLDGQSVEVALVKEGNQWKLDELTGFVKFDEAKVISTLEEGFGKPSDEKSKRIVSCIIESLEEAPQAKFEDALLSASTKGLEELAGDCF
jgi:hypothetical protein